MNQITTEMAVKTQTARRVRLLQHSSSLLLLYCRNQQLKIIGCSYKLIVIQLSPVTLIRRPQIQRHGVADNYIPLYTEILIIDL